MSDDVDIQAARKMLQNLASSSTDPSLFSFSFIRDLQRQLSVHSGPSSPSSGSSYTASSRSRSRSPSHSRSPSRAPDFTAPTTAADESRPSTQSGIGSAIASAGLDIQAAPRSPTSKRRSRNPSKSPPPSPPSGLRAPEDRQLHHLRRRKKRKRKMTDITNFHFSLFNPQQHVDSRLLGPWAWQDDPTSARRGKHSNNLFGPSSASAGAVAGLPEQQPAAEEGGPDETSIPAITLPPILTLEEVKSQVSQKTGMVSGAMTYSSSAPLRAPPLEAVLGEHPLLPTHYAAPSSGPYGPTPSLRLPPGPIQQSFDAPPPYGPTGFYAPLPPSVGQFDPFASQPQHMLPGGPFYSHYEQPPVPLSVPAPTTLSRPGSSGHSSHSSGGDKGSPGPESSEAVRSERSTTPADSVPQRRTGKLPVTVTNTLKGWLLSHTQHPYPTEEEKRMLCSETHLTMNQVSNWFINARRRILPQLGAVSVSGNRKQVSMGSRTAPGGPGDRLPAVRSAPYQQPPSSRYRPPAYGAAYPPGAYPQPGMVPYPAMHPQAGGTLYHPPPPQ